MNHDVLRQSLFVILPYFVANLCMAAYTAYQEYAFGIIGGPTLAAEADCFHYLFLFMGTAMGGLRATSILVSRELQAMPLVDPSATTVWRLLRAGRFSNRDRQSVGLKAQVELNDSVALVEHEPRTQLLTPLCASCSMLCYSLFATVGLYFSRNGIRFIASETSNNVLAAVEDFGTHFFWASAPTLLLFNKCQTLLAVEVTGLVLVYYGFVYCGVGSLLLWGWGSSSAGGVSQSLAISASVAYVLLKLHIWCDPCLRWRSINSEELLVTRLIALNYGAHDSNHVSLTSVWHRHRSQLRIFLFLAVPLGISNSLSLTRQLVTAGMTTECSSDAAQSFSIANAYFSVAEVGLLAISSAVSSMVSSAVASSSSLGDARRREKVAVAIVCALGLIIGLPPVVAPASVARVFGGSVYAYGESEVVRLSFLVVRYDYITFGGYILALGSMSLSAVLHGRLFAWSPLIMNAIGNIAGVVWVVSFSHWHQESCVWQAGAGIVANTVSCLLLCGLLVKSNLS